MDRIPAIQKMLQSDPDDLFLNYSLGMELLAAERFGESADAFKKCIELDEDYLPAHVEAGKALRSAGRVVEARDVLVAGSDLAGRLGETHTHEYIRQLLEVLSANKDG